MGEATHFVDDAVIFNQALHALQILETGFVEAALMCKLHTKDDDSYE